MNSSVSLVLEYSIRSKNSGFAVCTKYHVQKGNCCLFWKTWCWVMAGSTGQQKLGTISKYKEVQEPDVISISKGTEILFDSFNISAKF